jgi:hypothetical protein
MNSSTSSPVLLSRGARWWRQVAFITKQCLKHLARLNLPVYIFEKDDFKVAYAGYSEVKKNYSGRFPFGNQPANAVFVGRKWFWQVTRLEVDITFAEVSLGTMPYFRHASGFVLPEWVTMHISTTQPMSELRQPSVSHFADIERLIRKHALGFETSTATEDVNQFYQEMYLPYTRTRHKDEALIESLGSIFDPGKDFFMLFIREKGQRVAAGLIERHASHVHLKRLGVKDGHEQYMRHGAVGAIYYFLYLEAQRLGCRYIDIGGSRPFLTDGLTRHKLGLHAQFHSDHSTWREYLWMGIDPNSARGQGFIRDNPFVYLSGNHQFVRSDAQTDSAMTSTP